MASHQQSLVAKRDDLQAVWESIAHSNFYRVGVEQKRLLAHGVGIAVRTIISGGADPVDIGRQDVNDYYEKVLSGISILAGRTQTMKVEDAKAWIRSFEDEESFKIASRLGRLSKNRNGKVHQDWLVQEAVEALVTRCRLASSHGYASDSKTQDEGGPSSITGGGTPGIEKVNNMDEDDQALQSHDPVSDASQVSSAVQTEKVCCFSAEEMKQFMRKTGDRDDVRERLSEKRIEEMRQKMEEMHVQNQKVCEDMTETIAAQLNLLAQCKQQLVSMTAERDLLADRCRKPKSRLKK